MRVMQSAARFIGDALISAFPCFKGVNQVFFLTGSLLHVPNR